MATLHFLNTSPKGIRVPPLILASGSPTRAKILQEMQLDFTVDPADIDEESYSAASTEQLTQLLAMEKAKVGAAQHPNAIVIAADTLIVLMDANREIILGKPKDTSHAKAILQQLSGKTHKAVTGLCVYNPLATGEKQFHLASETTYVTFKTITPQEIDQYVASGAAMGKAGAYGIQGPARQFISKIAGNEDNVAGLPVALLIGILKQEGYSVYNVKEPDLGE